MFFEPPGQSRGTPVQHHPNRPTVRLASSRQSIFRAVDDTPLVRLSMPVPALGLLLFSAELVSSTTNEWKALSGPDPQARSLQYSLLSAAVAITISRYQQRYFYYGCRRREAS